MKKIVLLAILVNLCLTTQAQDSDFVKVVDRSFQLNDEPYRFIGANLWYGMNLGSKGEGSDQARLIRELDRLQMLGVNNLRIMGASEGDENSPYQIQPTLQYAPDQYNEELFEGLDFLLAEMEKRNMKAVVCLSNYWMWSGGFPQYVSWATRTEIPYPDVMGGSSWDEFINYSLSFYSNRKAMDYYWEFLKTIVGRTNTITGLPYKEDPTIMAWQLCNEPRGYTQPKKYRQWVKKSVKFLNDLDENHLISIGSEGDTNTPISGVNLYKDNKTKGLDYVTTHVWIQNWGWFDPTDEETFEASKAKTAAYLRSQIAKAEKLNKPLVIEEFGVSRDKGDFDVEASIAKRDEYYAFIFDLTMDQIEQNGIVQGCNFWSWGGEGRPIHQGNMWQKGNDLIGDPPHERQGWYSVYDKDQSTIELIKKYNLKIGNLMGE